MTGFEISHLLTSTLVEFKNTDSPRHEFYVHQALVDELCHPLCDELREYWKVFDGGTVGRFAQYLYKADCCYPAPIPVGTMTPTGTASDGPKHPPTPPSSLKDGAANALDDAIGPHREIRTFMRPLTPLKGFKIPKLHVASECAPPVGPMTPTGHCYEAVLLALARLYILSYSQGTYELSDLCISSLRHELDEISPPPVGTQVPGDVVKLLRYAYFSPRDTASPQPLQPAWAELQSLVSQFCALNIDLMEGNQEFMALLGEAGPLAADMMAKTVRRLRSAEAALTRANNTAAPVENKKAGRLLEQPSQRAPPLENLEQPYLEQPRRRTPHVKNLEQPYLEQPRRRTPHPENLEQPYLEQPRQPTTHVENLEQPYLEQPRRRTSHPENLEQPYLEQPRRRTRHPENLEQPYLEQPRRQTPHPKNLESPYLEHPRQQTPQLGNLGQPYFEHPRQRTPHPENSDSTYLEHPRRGTPYLENSEAPYLDPPRRRTLHLENLESPYMEQPRRRTTHLGNLEQLYVEQPRRRPAITTNGSDDEVSTYEAVPEGEGEVYSVKEDDALPWEFGATVIEATLFGATPVTNSPAYAIWSNLGSERST